MDTLSPVVEKTSAHSLSFTQRRNFQKTLTERVNACLRDYNLPARDVPAAYLKTVLVLAWWLAAYLLLLAPFPVWANLLLGLNWALSITALGLNVTHDANHGAYSNSPRVNRLFSLSAELIGFSSFRWRTKHNVWHHTYTNIAGYDDDLETFGLMRLTPGAPWRPLHRAQVWFFPLIYAMIGFDFVLRDFMMALTGKSDANHVYPKMSRADRLIFWLGKLLFFTLMIGIPLLFHPLWLVLVDFFLVVALIGLLLGVVFQLAHINLDATFPIPVGSPQHIENEWAIHQVETTADFAQTNWLLTHYIGGLNFQVEHHLFPHINHLNYSRIAPIVRATCAEFGIRYTAYPSWGEAFAAHLRHLRLLGQPPPGSG